MSIAFELFKSIGKKPCPPGSRVDRCPMVINENSEDILTSSVFGLLKYLPPAFWLVPLLEQAFRGRTFQGLGQSTAKIQFWQKLSAPPTTKHPEGVEEIDILIRIRHLIILVECKFRSPVNMGGSGSSARDQIARYLDAAVFNLWPDSDTKREIYLVLLTDTEEEPTILSRYRNPETVLACLAQDRPFVDYEEVSQMLARNVGWITWRDLLNILERKDSNEADPAKAMIIKDIVRYLKYKLDRR